MSQPRTDNELLRSATERIHNAAHELAQALSAVGLEWDMSLIARITDEAEDVLKSRNIPVCYPWENEDGHICYSTPERCAYCNK